MANIDEYTAQALEHIRHLSETIGGRGSCTAAERRAAEYAAEQMNKKGVKQVRLESYRGAPSTYRPYILTFTAALLGTLVAWVLPGRFMLALAALLNALGAWGMLAESDLSANWMRYLLPKAESQNAMGVIPAKGERRQQVVLCAHLDTHRTPVFYSSTTWHSLFSLLVGLAFASMGISFVAYGAGAAFEWFWVRWVGLIAAAMEIFALALCLHADFTPFSPGANDDASGVGVILALAERLRREPLAQTEVWLAFTGCEEVGAHGITAFLNAHAVELGEDAIYLILDEVGLSQIKMITADGLIRKHKTHPRALELARRAATALPGLKICEQVGPAYTDALAATQRGLIALTLCTEAPPGSHEVSHWHQMSDTLDHVNSQGLADAHAFTWQIIQEIDRRVYRKSIGET